MSDDQTPKIASDLGSKENSKNKKRTPHRVLLLVGLLILAVMAGIYIYFLQTYNKIDYVEIPNTDEELGITEDIEEEINIFENNKSIINILLFGIDKRSDEERGRSDAMMILTIDPVSNSIKLSSLMRDTRVTIKGYKEDKLGHAY